MLSCQKTWLVTGSFLHYEDLPLFPSNVGMCILTGSVKTVAAGRSVGCGIWSLLELSRMRTPTPKSYHHWHPLAFRRASSHHYCACKVFSKSKSRWPGHPGGGASGVRGLMRDNWFSAAPCRDAGQQNSWNLENVKNKLWRSGFIWRSTSMWNEKASFPFFFLSCFECSKRALPGKSQGLKCQIASGNVGRSWWSGGAATQNTRKALSTEKKSKHWINVKATLS